MRDVIKRLRNYKNSFSLQWEHGTYGKKPIVELLEDAIEEIKHLRKKNQRLEERICKLNPDYIDQIDPDMDLRKSKPKKKLPKYLRGGCRKLVKA